MNVEAIEQFYEKITMTAVAETVEKLLMYPFGFHGDTGIRDYLYARLHVHGGHELEFSDPQKRPGFSTLLLQAEHYTHAKYQNTGRSGKRARFDLALTLPPDPSDDPRSSYADNLRGLFAFELGKNKALDGVIDPEMLSHGDDTITGTSDISKLYRDLRYRDHTLKQGWAIEFYDSRTRKGGLIIEKTLEVCRKIRFDEERKLVVVFVEHTRDGGRYQVWSNDQTVRSSLTDKLASTIRAGGNPQSLSATTLQRAPQTT